MTYNKTIMFLLVAILVVGFGVVSNTNAQTYPSTSSTSTGTDTTSTTSTTSTTTDTGTTGIPGGGTTSTTPTFPNTGAGGDLPLNMAILVSSGLVALGGMATLAKQYVSKK